LAELAVMSLIPFCGLILENFSPRKRPRRGKNLGGANRAGGVIAVFQDAMLIFPFSQRLL